MLHACHRCTLEMGNDNSGCLDEWPRPKKSKRYDDTPSWNCLPAAILDNIFQYLTFKDIINASSTCINWRPGLYHPRLWQNVTFVITPSTLPKVQYLRTMVGCMASNATVRFNSMITSCVVEFLLLLDYFTCNNNLQSLMLEPSHCHLLIPDAMLETMDMHSPSNTLLKIISNNSMTKISLGCSEDLLQVSNQILRSLTTKPNDVTTLGLASVKDDPFNYFIYDCDPKLFIPFQNLQILSIDYDNLNDEFLDALQNMNDLLRIVVHMHGIWEGHPGTSDQAWRRLKTNQPNCLLRLSLIHAYDEVDILHDEILKDNMPLSHLKVLFCEGMNSYAMEKLIKYHETFVSLMWIDSISDDIYDGQSCSLLTYPTERSVEEPQNLILIAWLCKKLEEIVVLGYKYYEEDWLGVSRLTGSRLKRLEIAAADVLYTSIDRKEDLQSIMGKTWKPLEVDDLHPVVQDPTHGDSDEYLMPILTADLH